MLFRQIYDSDSSTHSYLLADSGTREAILIDPVRELADRDIKLVEELGLRLAYVFDTHTHADHITAAATLRQTSGARTVAGRFGRQTNPNYPRRIGSRPRVAPRAAEYHRAGATEAHGDYTRCG